MFQNVLDCNRLYAPSRPHLASLITGTFGAAQSLETVRKLGTKLNPEESTYFLFLMYL